MSYIATVGKATELTEGGGIWEAGEIEYKEVQTEQKLSVRHK